MSKVAFGIDLGTSTSIVSYIENERPVTINDPKSKSPIVPSEVGLAVRDRSLLVGSDVERGLPDSIIREAKRYMGTDFSYIIGADTLTPSQVASLVLKKLKQNAEQVTGHELTEAVITVPAYFDDVPRRATEMAAHLAGIKVLRLISEPVAAAMAYGMDKLTDDATLLVFDFGGGTLDVTIIDMLAGILDVRATHGDKELGGKDIDQAFMDFVVSEAQAIKPHPGTKYFEELRKQVVSAKKALSVDSSADVLLDIRDERSGALIDIDISITRKQFDSVVQPFVDRAVNCISEALKKAGIDKSRVSRILLVGGTCYIPKVRESVENYFALKAEPGVDPDLAVSLGAAISAGLKTGAVDSATSVIVQDAATYRIGTSIFSNIGGQNMLMFSELMPANAKIPFVRTVRYSLMTTTQDEVEVDVLLDLSNKAVFPEDAVPTGAVGLLRDIPPSPTGEPWAIDVEIQYDENHIVRVQAKIVGLDKILTLQLNRPDFVSTSGLADAQLSTVDNLWESSPQAARNNALISRTEKFAAENPKYAEKLEAMVSTLKRAIQSDDEEAIRVARIALAEYLASIQ